jgi:hypothetical protein
LGLTLICRMVVKGCSFSTVRFYRTVELQNIVISCNHAIVLSCTINRITENHNMMALNYKVVGKSGQISLGKNFAGVAFLVEKLAGGDFILKKATVMPSNEQWIYEPALQSKLTAADEWMQNNPAQETDLDALKNLAENSSSQQK